MNLFRVYVDGTLFYHPQMSKLAITGARIEEDAENIDSMTLSAPFNHPYLSSKKRHHTFHQNMMSYLAKDCYLNKMRVIVEFYSFIIQKPE